MDNRAQDEALMLRYYNRTIHQCPRQDDIARRHYSTRPMSSSTRASPSASSALPSRSAAGHDGETYRCLYGNYYINNHITRRSTDQL